jgi:hypothetical protein
MSGNRKGEGKKRRTYSGRNGTDVFQIIHLGDFIAACRLSTDKYRFSSDSEFHRGQHNTSWFFYAPRDCETTWLVGIKKIKKMNKKMFPVPDGIANDRVLSHRFRNIASTRRSIFCDLSRHCFNVAHRIALRSSVLKWRYS